MIRMFAVSCGQGNFKVCLFSSITPHTPVYSCYLKFQLLLVFTFYNLPFGYPITFMDLLYLKKFI